MCVLAPPALFSIYQKSFVIWYKVITTLWSHRFLLYLVCALVVYTVSNWNGGDKISSYMTVLLFSYKFLHEPTESFIKARLTTHFVWALTSPLIQIGNRSASQEKDRAVYSSQTLLDLWCSAFLTLVQYTIWSTSVMSHLVGEEEHRRGRRKKDIKTKTHISTSQINGGCQTLGKLPPKGISRFITSFLSGWIQPSKNDHGIQNVCNMKQKTTALVFIVKILMSS